jgi:hypothetical protein
MSIFTNNNTLIENMSKRRFDPEKDLGSPLKKTKTIDLSEDDPPNNKPPIEIDLSRNDPPPLNRLDSSRNSPIDLISDDKKRDSPINLISDDDDEEEDDKKKKKRDINKWNSNQSSNSRADRLLEDANASELQFGQSPETVDFTTLSPEIFRPSSSNNNNKPPALKLFKPKPLLSSNNRNNESPPPPVLNLFKPKPSSSNKNIVYDSQEEDEEESPSIRKLSLDEDNESVPATSPPPEEDQVFEKAFQEQKEFVDSDRNSRAVSETEQQEYIRNQKRMQELEANQKYRQQKNEEEAQQNAAPELWSTQYEENVEMEEAELKQLKQSEMKQLQAAHESDILPLYDEAKDTFMQGDSNKPVTKESLAGLSWCSDENEEEEDDEDDKTVQLRVYLVENPYTAEQNDNAEFKDIQDFVNREFRKFGKAFGVYVRVKEKSKELENGDILVSSTPDEMRFCGIDTKIFTNQLERRNVRKQRTRELDPAKHSLDKKSEDFHLFRQIIPAETVLRCYVYSLAQECLKNARTLTRTAMKQGIESKYPKLSRNLLEKSKPVKITTCLYPHVHGMPFHGPYWRNTSFHPKDDESICMDNLWMIRHEDDLKSASVVWDEQPDKDETETNKIGFVLRTRRKILRKRELVLQTQAGKSREEVQQKQQKTNQKKSEAQREKKEQEKKETQKKKAKDDRMYDEFGIDRKDSESESEEDEDDPATKAQEAALKKQREEAEKALGEFMKTL